MSDTNHKPVVNEIFADNGEHSHWELIDSSNGRILWSESPPSTAGEGAKSATQILSEHGINVMELNDDFNTQPLHAMERYAEQCSEHTRNGFVVTLKILRTVLKTAGLELGVKKADELIKDYSNT